MGGAKMSRKRKEAAAKRMAAVQRQAVETTVEVATQIQAAATVPRLAMELTSAWDAAEKVGVPMDVTVDKIRLGNGQIVKQVLAHILV